MSRRTMLQVPLLALLIAFSGCSSCTDETASNNSTNNNREEPSVDVPAGSRLEHVADSGPESCDPIQPVCVKNVTFSSGALLKVKLVDGQNQAIDNTTVNFTINAGPAAGTTLDSASAVTDPAGIAEVNVRAGVTAGPAEVVVSAGGTSGVRITTCSE